MPTAPTSLTLVSVGAGTISLTWVDTSTNETAVQVQRSGDLATWVDAATLAANSTVFTDIKPFEPETTYHYRVCNASGCSPCSVPAGGTTHPLPPAAPSGLAAVVLGCNAVTLTWECAASPNVAGFRVECSASEERLAGDGCPARQQHRLRADRVGALHHLSFPHSGIQCGGAFDLFAGTQRQHARTSACHDNEPHSQRLERHGHWLGVGKTWRRTKPGGAWSALATW